MARKCAYCGKTSPLTREHLFPQSLDRLIVGKGGPQWLEKSESGYIGSSPVLRDVCGDCNNGPLSELDHYAVKLFKPHLKIDLRQGESLSFEYNFDLLLRWLLKVTYNSSRASDSCESLIARHREYILAKRKRPKDVVLGLNLVSTYEPNDDDKRAFADKGQESGSIAPDWWRTSRVLLPGHLDDKMAIRAVFVQKFCFLLMFFHKQMKFVKRKSVITDLKKYEYNAKILCADNNKISLSAGSLNPVNSLHDHFTFNADRIPPDL